GPTCSPRDDSRLDRPGLGLELGKHAVDEALDRARGLEPEAQQNRLGTDARVGPLLERGYGLVDGLALREQQRRRVDAVALREHELQEQERPPLADVLDRLRQPRADGLVTRRRGPEDRAVRPAHA